jgi:hypothetical protein
VGKSVVATPVAAGAPPLNHNDNPAAPNTGTPFLRCLWRVTFACDIAEFPIFQAFRTINMLYFEGFNKRQKGQHSSEITIALDIHKLADRAAASTRASGAALPERCIGA